MSSYRLDWSRWLYQEEKLHTSVLAHLLSLPHGEEAADESVLQDLLRTAYGPGAAPPLGAVMVVPDSVQPESWIHRRPPGTLDDKHEFERQKRRAADLACGLRLGDDPKQVGQLVVETKVDSYSSRPQLDDMSWANNHVLLLALGTSAFARSQDDLDADADAGYITFEDTHLEDEGVEPVSWPRRGASPRSWPVLGPQGWAAFLERWHLDDDPAIGDYIVRMRIEAALHEAAWVRSEDGSLGRRSDVTSREFGLLPNSQQHKLVERLAVLGAEAWSARVRGTLRQFPSHQGRSSAQAPAITWNAESRAGVSGCRLFVWPAGWSGDGCDVFLQVDIATQAARVQPRPRLGVRGPAEFQRQVAELVPAELRPKPLKLTGHSKSVTLADGEIDGASPSATAAWIASTAAAVDSDGALVHQLRRRWLEATPASHRA